MDKSKFNVIRSRMEQKPTEELIAIWKTNDRKEWSDDAFEAIRQVLGKRNIDPPAQAPAVKDAPEKTRGGGLQALCSGLGGIFVLAGSITNPSTLDLLALVCAIVASAIRNKRASLPLTIIPLVVVIFDLVARPTLAFEFWFRVGAITLLAVSVVKLLQSSHEVGVSPKPPETTATRPAVEPDRFIPTSSVKDVPIDFEKRKRLVAIGSIMAIIGLPWLIYVFRKYADGPYVSTTTALIDSLPLILLIAAITCIFSTPRIKTK